MPWRFENCWQRIDRADVHSKAFAKVWNDLSEEDTYSAGVRVDDDGTGRIWLEPMHFSGFPPLASLELGEMLHQLRAALDASIYECAIVETGKRPPPNEQHLEFPIFETSPGFAKNAPGMLGPLTQDRWDIIEAVQPYNISKLTLAPEQMVANPNCTLSILNDWARKDRHRRLHFVGSWASNASPKLRLPDGVSIASMVVSGAGFLEQESQIAEFKLEGWVPGMHIQANPDVAIDVAIDEIPPACADNDTTGNRLLAMIGTVKGIVMQLEESFEGRGLTLGTHRP